MNVCFSKGSEKMVVAPIGKRDELVINTLGRDAKFSAVLRKYMVCLIRSPYKGAKVDLVEGIQIGNQCTLDRCAKT